MANQNYNDSHRLFIQAMLSKRIITESEAHRLYERVGQVTQVGSETDYPLFIAAINKELEELDFSLRISHDERTGEAFLSYINLKQDPMTEIATTFSPKELAYIRELLNKIVNAEDENFAIKSMTAIRLASKITPTNLTSKEAQEVLDQLVKEKWLAFELEKGVYYIDTRGIAELQGYLREQYGEAMKECTFCLDVVTMGECCTNTNCNVRIHKYCAESQFKNATNPVCPACTAPWSRTNTFGLGLPETAMNPDYQSEEEEEEEDQ